MLFDDEIVNKKLVMPDSIIEYITTKLGLYRKPPCQRDPWITFKLAFACNAIML